MTTPVSFPRELVFLNASIKIKATYKNTLIYETEKKFETYSRFPFHKLLFDTIQFGTKLF